MKRFICAIVLAAICVSISSAHAANLADTASIAAQSNSGVISGPVNNTDKVYKDVFSFVNDTDFEDRLADFLGNKNDELNKYSVHKEFMTQIYYYGQTKQFKEKGMDDFLSEYTYEAWYIPIFYENVPCGMFEIDKAVDRKTGIKKYEAMPCIYGDGKTKVEYLNLICDKSAMNALLEANNIDLKSDIKVLCEGPSCCPIVFYVKSGNDKYMIPFYVEGFEDGKPVKWDIYVNERSEYERKATAQFQKENNIDAGGTVASETSQVSAAQPVEEVKAVLNRGDGNTESAVKATAKPNKYLIAGVSGGAAVVVALIVFALWLFVFRKRKHA